MVASKKAYRFKKLLLENLPRHQKRWPPEDGKLILDVKKISEEIGVSSKVVWFWLSKGKLPPRRISQLTKLKGSTLTIEMLAPFANFE